VRFPVTEQLVGHDFFAAMARTFAEGSRPGSPVLIGYGETFPDFIRSFQPASSVPYLSDVASLENLWWRAYHAADRAVSAQEDFAAIAAERWGDARFTFHPALGLMQSPFAAVTIWQAHYGGPGMTEIAIAAPESILVARPDDQVTVRVVSAATHDFIAALVMGDRLAEAVERTAAVHDDFDLAVQVQGLLGLGIITGISV
jgi:Putative DNA-binding domain